MGWFPSRGAGGGTGGRNAATCGVPGPLLQRPASGSRPTGGEGFAACLPASLLLPLPMPGRHSGRLGPHPPGVLRTQRRGLAPSQLGERAGRYGRLLPAPPLHGVPGAHTPTHSLGERPPFPSSHTSTWPQGPPARHHHPTTLSPRPFATVKRILQTGLLAQLQGPCHLPDLTSPSTDPAASHPQAPLLHTPKGLSSRAQLHPRAHCLRDSLFTHSFMAGTHAIVRGCTRGLFVKYVPQLDFQLHSVIHPSMLW